MGKGKVLIIDDDPIHQRIAQLMIQKQQLFDEIKSFTNATHAVSFLDENAENTEALPDVILLDLNMPIMDGWGFLEEYRTLLPKLAKAIKIFIVSSSVDEKDMLRSQTYSYVKGFISKPLSPDIIRTTL
jgi:CheY-like chemotaxis protein